MPMEAPKAHLYHSIKLEVARIKLGHGGRKSTAAGLNLVAYIDMMTVLVIFLLMTFQANGEILFIQKNITLPDAHNWSELERAPVIGVTKDVVTLDGRQVATELPEQVVVAAAAADRYADGRVVDLEHGAGVVAGCA